MCVTERERECVCEREDKRKEKREKYICVCMYVCGEWEYKRVVCYTLLCTFPVPFLPSSFLSSSSSSSSRSSGYTYTLKANSKLNANE